MMLMRALVAACGAATVDASLSAAGALATGGADSIGSAPAEPLTVDLTWSEAPAGFLGGYLRFDLQSGRFRKEPVAQRRVIRGSIFAGAIRTACLWAQTERKLYLDLNGNGDLTDDPEGVFISAGDMSGHAQQFHRVMVPSRIAMHRRRAVMDLTLIEVRNRIHCSATLRSLWLGQMEFDGEEWQLGVIDSVFNSGAANHSHLLMRPRAHRDRPFNAAEASADTFPYATRLFVHQRAFQLNATESDGGEPRLRIELTPQQPALGELRVSGRFIRRLTLLGGPFLVVLDGPEGVIRVPVGSYSTPKISLSDGSVAARPRTTYRRPASQRINVTESAAVELAGGGPLKNVVLASRRGDLLHLEHRLVGVEGESYTLENIDRSKPPEFVVYQNGRKIGTGKFEFG